jgi:23S rRNA pseudouridine2605 synthase
MNRPIRKTRTDGADSRPDSRQDSNSGSRNARPDFGNSSRSSSRGDSSARPAFRKSDSSDRPYTPRPRMGSDAPRPDRPAFGTGGQGSTPRQGAGGYERAGRAGGRPNDRFNDRPSDRQGDRFSDRPRNEGSQDSSNRNARFNDRGPARPSFGDRGPASGPRPFGTPRPGARSFDRNDRPTRSDRSDRPEQTNRFGSDGGAKPFRPFNPDRAKPDGYRGRNDRDGGTSSGRESGRDSYGAPRRLDSGSGFGNRPPRTGGDRPSFGNRPSFGDRPSRPGSGFGNRPDNGPPRNSDRPSSGNTWGTERRKLDGFRNNDRPDRGNDRPSRPWSPRPEGSDRPDRGNDRMSRPWSPRPEGGASRPNRTMGDRPSRYPRPALGGTSFNRSDDRQEERGEGKRTNSFTDNALRRHNEQQEKRRSGRSGVPERSTRDRYNTPPPSEPLEEGDGTIRLNRYIAASGICSRRDADTLISDGRISVNGKTVAEMGYKVKKDDQVRYGGRLILPEKHVYVLVNKPKDMITTLDDEEGRRTVMDLLENTVKERVYPVGRLDRNTTGLLLITNDGELAEKLSHPSFEIRKVYQADLDRPLTDNDYQQLKTGVVLEDGFAKLDDLAILSPDKRSVGLELHIGRNRIVRRLFEHLEYKVERLDRVMYGGLTKKDLPRGKFRHLTPQEIINLKHLA